MQIERRTFLRACIGSAVALSLPLRVVNKLESALAADGRGLPTVIWLNGANCTGCTVSLANLVSNDSPTDVADLLIHDINLAFHPNLMGAAGDLAVQTLNEAASGDYILAMDGGIPTACSGYTCMLWTEGGHEITAVDAVKSLAPSAQHILCIGTCASFGGIPAGNPNPAGIKSVGEIARRPTINIPGCPAHPDWIVWTIAHLLVGEVPTLDSQGRPAQLFRGEGRNIHNRCPRRESRETNTFGAEGACLRRLGCNGPRTQGDCPSRQWNNGTNWCIGANSTCLGCTEKNFPDSFSPFFNHEFVTVTVFAIRAAQWNAGRSELTVDGSGKAGASVRLTNARTGDLLGSTSVDSQGSWEIKHANPFPVPCRVQAVCDGQTVSAAVANAPADCDQDPDEDPRPRADVVTITRTKYSRKQKKLIVRAVCDSETEGVTLKAQGFGTLKYRRKKEEYKGKFTPVNSKPETVTVTSAGGGSDTKPVPYRR